MSEKLQKYSIQEIENRIFTIRGTHVMIDRDIAEMYDVETKVLNQAVKRNLERFPEKFRFQLLQNERNELVTNCDRLKKLKHSSVLPYAFTEQGVAMLSAVLNSKTAIQVSLQIMNAFVEMRKFITSNANVFQRLDIIEKNHLQFKSETNQNFDEIFHAIDGKRLNPEQGIFFEGQMYDAYTFASDLIRSAKKSIILIDNYIDDSVLTMLSKRQNNVFATIYTKSISKQLKLDLKKHNSQYPAIMAYEFKNAHDRFLILDETQVYHFGASLKDLGKKWFAFSRMDFMTNEVLQKLKKGGDDA
jgi:hypothetical protein